jgi:branched-chain amino acid transport system substrate-binding protein
MKSAIARLLALIGLALAALPPLAQAQVSGNVVKIGVMNDMSSLYSDIAGM